MSKNRFGKVDADPVEGLSLRFIDGHRKGNVNWELSSCPLKWKISFVRFQKYARYKYDSPGMLSADDFDFDDVVMYGS